MVTPKKNQNPKQKKANATQELGYFMSLGFRITGTVLAGAGVGYGIDQWMNNETPVFTLIFGVLAIIGAIIQFIRALI